MIPKVSIVMAIFNARPLVEESVTACLETMGDGCELILIDNHSLDAATGEYVRGFAPGGDKAGPDVTVMDMGENVGYLVGCNKGFRAARGEYVVKLDDDTVMQTGDWPAKMVEALEANPDMAYVSADGDAKFKIPRWKEVRGGIELELYDGVATFCCIMFKREWLLAVGGLRTGTFKPPGGGPPFWGYYANPEAEFIEREGRLYGGEEPVLAHWAIVEGKFHAALPSVFYHHIDTEDRDPDYVLWKYCYGYRGWTQLTLRKLKEDNIALVGLYARRIEEELTGGPEKQPINDVILRDCIKRLGELGRSDDLIELIERAASKTENGVVKETAGFAVNKIRGRLSK